MKDEISDELGRQIAEQSTKQDAADAKAEERKKLDESMRAAILDKEEDRRLYQAQLNEEAAMDAAAERKAKEIVVPPKPLTTWQRESQELEAEGVSNLGRNPEEVVLGEKRKDEGVGRI